MKYLKTCRYIAIGTLGLAVAGCSTAAGSGALIGGAAGAGAGAIIGHNSHGRTAGGALIGGAVGALSGALVGNEIDRQQAQDRSADESQNYDPPTGQREVIVEPRREVVVEPYDPYAPPPERVEVVPVRPYPRAVWVQGHWVRGYHHWIWVSGHWG